MPYKTRQDLPPGVRDHLPPHAQSIYRSAANAVEKKYGDDPSRVAAISWAAVKKLYKKDEKTGQWHRISESDPLQGSSGDNYIITANPVFLTKEAAADPPTGIMVALYPEPALAANLAIEGGEPAEELHLTAAYIGRMDGVDTDLLAQLPQIIEGFAIYAGQLDGQVNGIGRFLASESSDGKDVCYLSVDCPDLPSWRHHLEECLEDYGIEIDDKHGFQPHMTLQYLEPGAALPDALTEAVPIHFSQVRLVMGTASWTFDLHGLHELEPDDSEMEPAQAPMQAQSYAMYHEQGPRLAQEAYRALMGLAPSLDDADGLPSMLESLKALVPDDADVSPEEGATAEQAKEALEALKVWDLRTTEAGQRHAQWEYDLIDSLIDGLKRLRGVTPSEQKAVMADAQANTPEAQMMAGYKESADVDLEHVELHESALIVQEATGSNGHEWEVVIIEAGLSKNNRLYPLEVLRRAAPLFEGCRVYAYDRVLKGKPIYDHLSDAELQANGQGYVKDLVGYLKNPRIMGSRLVANLVILPSADWLRANLQRSFPDKPDVYGLSIDAAGDGHMVENVLHVDAIRVVQSTDVVSFPAAGGGFLRLVAGVDPLAYEQEVTTLMEGLSQELRTMHFRAALDDALDEAEVAGSVRRRLRARLLAALPM